jgi:Protein of unknown function (DUF1569)
MDSLFNAEDNNSIQQRINKLAPDAKPLWGKMNVSQMLAHLQPTMLVSFGELKLKRGLMGFLFGKVAKKKIVNEQPFKQNIPTLKEFKVAGKDFEAEKNKLLFYVDRVKTEGPKIFTSKPHPFFGKLTAEEWNMLQWKHLDHHLRQFGV